MDKEIWVRTWIEASGFEPMSDLIPETQDLVKRVLWQPEDVESSLGWWHLGGASLGTYVYLFDEEDGGYG
jgi:hypothetical protein